MKVSKDIELSVHGLGARSGRSRGMTLVEVLVSIIIVAILSTAIAIEFSRIAEQAWEAKLTELQSQLRFELSTITAKALTLAAAEDGESWYAESTIDKETAEPGVPFLDFGAKQGNENQTFASRSGAPNAELLKKAHTLCQGLSPDYLKYGLFAAVEKDKLEAHSYRSAKVDVDEIAASAAPGETFVLVIDILSFAANARREGDGTEIPMETADSGMFQKSAIDGWGEFLRTTGEMQVPFADFYVKIDLDAQGNVVSRPLGRATARAFEDFINTVNPVIDDFTFVLAKHLMEQALNTTIEGGRQDKIRLDLPADADLDAFMTGFQIMTGTREKAGTGLYGVFNMADGSIDLHNLPTDWNEALLAAFDKGPNGAPGDGKLSYEELGFVRQSATEALPNGGTREREVIQVNENKKLADLETITQPDGSIIRAETTYHLHTGPQTGRSVASTAERTLNGQVVESLEFRETEFGLIYSVTQYKSHPDGSISTITYDMANHGQPWRATVVTRDANNQVLSQTSGSLMEPWMQDYAQFETGLTPYFESMQQMYGNRGTLGGGPPN